MGLLLFEEPRLPIVDATPRLADWRFMVCDLNGNPLSNISPVATARKLSYRLMRPMQLTFEVPSDDPSVYTDVGGAGALIRPGRVIKGWRRDGAGVWTIRYAGYIWQVGDDGDEDKAKTKVTCYGPLNRLGRRLVRQGVIKINEIKMIRIVDDGEIGGTFTLTFNSQTTGAIAYNATPATVQAALEALSNINVGDVTVTDAGVVAPETLDQRIEFKGQYEGVDITSFSLDPAGLTGNSTTNQGVIQQGFTSAPDLVPTNGRVAFAAVQAELILRTLVDRTNAGGGVSGLRAPDAGPNVGTFSPEWQWGKVQEAMLSVAETAGLIFWEIAEDRTDGYLAKLKIDSAPATVVGHRLAWGGSEHTARRVEMLGDLEHLCNDLRVLGGASAALPTQRTDAPSIAAYGRYEDVRSYSDIRVQSHLDSLADQELALRKNPRTMVHIYPQHEPDVTFRELEPWLDFDFGWLLPVFVAKRLRGGIEGQQRIWGWELDVSNDGVERVERLHVGSDT